MMKKTVLTLSLLLAAVALQAQNTALSFTAIERNPRAAAMAGAGAASVNNMAWDGFAHAAMVPLSQSKLDAGVGVQLWAPGDAFSKTTNLQLGVSGRIGHLGLSLAGAYQMGVAEDGFAPSDYLVGLGVSYGIGQYVSLGVNLRYAGQKLAPNATLGGFSGDFSVAGKLPAGFTLAAGLSTLGTRVKGSGDASYGQPTRVFLGAAWNKSFAEKHSLEMALDGEYAFDKAFAGALGAEYGYNQLLFVRAGYRLASANAIIPSHLSAGLGVQYAGVRLEVTWMGLCSYAPLNNTLTFGIGYRF